MRLELIGTDLRATEDHEGYPSEVLNSFIPSRRPRIAVASVESARLRTIRPMQQRRAVVHL